MIRAWVRIALDDSLRTHLCDSSQNVCASTSERPKCDEAIVRRGAAEFATSIAAPNVLPFVSQHYGYPDIHGDSPCGDLSEGLHESHKNGRQGPSPDIQFSTCPRSCTAHFFPRIITMSGQGSNYRSIAYHDEDETYDPNEILQAQSVADGHLWNNYQWNMSPAQGPSSAFTSNYVLASAIPTTQMVKYESDDKYLSGPTSDTLFVPQELYGDSKGQDLSKDDVYFETPGCPGINLAEALRGQVDQLYHRDDPAFLKQADVSSKISVRIQVPVCSSSMTRIRLTSGQFQGYKAYHRQVMALRSTSSAEGISIGKLAQKIAEETKACLDKKEEIVVGGRTFFFSDMFLYRLRRATKGSWQPEFWILLH
ncbi:hypothetical protein C2E23DRAFT_80633 [Lenzites betulinus]|nr:hypothetical protein C2E23DRAFT_80633 [Lenzites betulinus]